MARLSTTPLPTKQPDSHDLAWAAGFFDGEGCFRSSPTVRYDTLAGSRCRRYLRLDVTQKHAPLLEKMRDIFGVGKVYAYKERPTSGAGFRYVVNGRSAFYVADLLWPWLGEQKKADFKRTLCAVLESRRDLPAQLALSNCEGGQ